MPKLFNPQINLVILNVSQLEFIPELIPFLSGCQCLSVFSHGTDIYTGPVSGAVSAFTHSGLESDLRMILENYNLYPVISIITHIECELFHITSFQNSLTMPTDAKQYGTDLDNIFELISMLQVHDL